MAAKLHKFQYLNKPRFKIGIAGKVVELNEGDIVSCREDDESYKYLVENTRRFEELTYREAKEEDLKDDGLRNFSTEPQKEKKKKKESD